MIHTFFLLWDILKIVISGTQLWLQAQQLLFKPFIYRGQPMREGGHKGKQAKTACFGEMMSG